MLICHHQRNPEGGSFPFYALDADEPAVLLDDSIADRESETSSAVLRGKERGEDMGQVVLFNSDTLILDVHPNQPAAIASLTTDVKVGFHPCRHGQGAASVHRLKCVFHQVEKNLRQLCSVAADRRQAGIEAFLDSDAQLVR